MRRRIGLGVKPLLPPRGEVSSQQYITVPDGMGFNWTKNNLEALRFARREDADMVALIIDEDAERVCFHEWGKPQTADVRHQAVWPLCEGNVIYVEAL